MMQDLLALGPQGHALELRDEQLEMRNLTSTRCHGRCVCLMLCGVCFPMCELRDDNCLQRCVIKGIEIWQCERVRHAQYTHQTGLLNEGEPS